MEIKGMHEIDLIGSDTFYNVLFNSTYDFEYPAHWHCAIEVVYVKKGCWRIDAGSRAYALGEKDIIIIPPGTIHSFPLQKQDGLRLFLHFDLIKLNMVKSCLKTMAPHSTQVIIPDNKIHKSLEKIIENIFDELTQKNEFYELAIQSKLLDFLVVLSRTACNAKNQNSPFERKGSLNKINKAIEYIQINFKNKISLEDTAKWTGFSKYHLSKMFKETTGSTFHTFLSDYRVNKAISAISSSNITITQAALDSGFNSITTFNRVFKKLKGCSPKEFMIKKGI